MLKGFMKMSFLSDEERKLLIKTALQEVKENKTRSFSELIQELSLEEENWVEERIWKEKSADAENSLSEKFIFLN